MNLPPGMPAAWNFRRTTVTHCTDAVRSGALPP